MSIISFLGQFLFPSFCCSCKEFGSYLCEYCYDKLQFYIFPIPLHSLKLDDVYLDQLISAVEYEKTIGSVLHFLKYKHGLEIGKLCGDLLYFSTVFPQTDFITAVPLHSSRKSERGFNQSEIIAQRLSEHTETPYKNFLKRVKKTASQASMRDRKARLHNLDNIFEFTGKTEELADKSVLLVDDVCTTGTTLNECARFLKKNGAKTVIGLTVAHGF